MDPNIVIREIVADDAPAYNIYRRLIADEPENNVGQTAGEYTRTADEDRQFLLTLIANPNQNIYIARLDDRIIGTCMCRGGSLSAVRHVVGLGMDVDPEYRSQGIGGALLVKMIDWAQQHPVIRRIELTVFTRNRPAINLYLKHGFVVEALQREAYFKDGEYIDAYAMALLFRK